MLGLARTDSLDDLPKQQQRLGRSSGRYVLLLLILNRQEPKQPLHEPAKFLLRAANYSPRGM
ncbi:MAG: hypothetical protein DME20_07215 [Verrucomicrobia bacterium]|nr:MAG: hypothetical protein DME20_07215 [Verrucomicrobiota bacterium]